MKKFHSFLLNLAAVTMAACYNVFLFLRIPMPQLQFGVIDSSLVSNTIQPLYSKKLLDHAIQATHLVEYAQQEELPANSGNTSIRFYRPSQADLTATGAPAALTEGTAPTNFRDVSYTAIDVSLTQIGQVSKVSDIANNVGLVKYLDNAITLQAEEFALDVDTRIRNIVAHASTGGTKRYAQGLADFASTASATLANSRLVPRDFLDAMTRLKINRAPMVNGHYVAIVPPQGTRDILNDSEFREVVRQNYADKIFKGEIGDYFGLRIVEGTNPFQEDETEGTFASTFSSAGSNTTGFIYHTVVTGKNGYGAVAMKKMGASLLKPQVVIVNTPDSANPLNQYIIVGWKAYWASKVLNQNWIISLRHKTLFA
jgi:N4-gp56 family major capsid protein